MTIGLFMATSIRRLGLQAMRPNGLRTESIISSLKVGLVGRSGPSGLPYRYGLNK